MTDNNLENQPATKGDVKLSADSLRSEMASVKTELTHKIDSVEQRLDQKIDRVYISQVQADSKLEQKMDKMLSKLDKLYSDLMSAFERTVVKGAKYDQKAESHAGILDGHTETLANHETRLQKLEPAK